MDFLYWCFFCEFAKGLSYVKWNREAEEGIQMLGDSGGDGRYNLYI